MAAISSTSCTRTVPLQTHKSLTVHIDAHTTLQQKFFSQHTLGSRFSRAVPEVPLRGLQPWDLTKLWGDPLQLCGQFDVLHSCYPVDR